MQIESCVAWELSPRALQHLGLRVGTNEQDYERVAREEASKPSESIVL